MNLTEATAAELLALQAAGQASAAEIAEAFLASIAARDPAVQAFLLVDEAGVRSQAAAIDARRKSGAKLGPLAGVPVAVKDVLCTKGCGRPVRARCSPTSSRPTTPTPSSA